MSWMHWIKRVSVSVRKRGATRARVLGQRLCLWHTMRVLHSLAECASIARLTRGVRVRNPVDSVLPRPVCAAYDSLCDGGYHWGCAAQPGTKGLHWLQLVCISERCMEDWTCVAQENVLTGPREMGVMWRGCLIVSPSDRPSTRCTGFQCAE
jgi:hypothetical protein